MITRHLPTHLYNICGAQVVTHRLPRLNKEEAGAMVFLGFDSQGTKCDDIAANPEVVHDARYVGKRSRASNNWCIFGGLPASAVLCPVPNFSCS